MAANNEIDLRRFFGALQSHKWLFGTIFAIIFGLGLTFALTRPTRYTSTATILIEDGSADLAQRAGGSALAMMMRTFSIGGFASSSVDNEMVLVASRDIAYRTVRRLSLNITAARTHGLTKTPLWKDSPATLVLPPGLADSMTLSDGFTVTLHLSPDGQAKAEAFRGRLFSTTLGKAEGKLPLALATPLGNLTILPTDTPLPDKDVTIKYTVTGYAPAAEKLLKDIDIDLADKGADAILVELTGDCPARDRAILDTMLDEYNAKRTDHRRQTAQTEVDFLNERIETLFGDLLDSEKKIEEFKSRSNFVSIENEAPILLESSLEAHELLLTAGNEILYCEQVLDALKSGQETMLPSYSVPGSESEANPMVTAYNEQLMLLNELRRSAMPGNHALQLAEERVGQMRESVIESVSQTLAAARKAVSARSGAVGRMDSHLRKLPAYEREYLNLSRDNLIKNELYAFLLEKRESSLLKYYSRATLGFVVDPAFTSVRPNYTRTVAFIGISLFLALLAVGCLGLIFMWRRNKICTPYDVASAGLEKQTVVRGGDSRRYANEIRAIITGKNPRATIFMVASSPTEAPVMGEITGAFTRAEIPFEIIDGEKTNDTLLSTRIRRQIDNAAVPYVFITVPELDRLTDIAPLLSRDEALLLVIIPAYRMPRAFASRLAAECPPDKIILAIC